LEHTSYHTTLNGNKKVGQKPEIGNEASSSKGIAYRILDIDNAISNIAGVYM